jgi:hypothetical protein
MRTKGAKATRLKYHVDWQLPNNIKGSDFYTSLNNISKNFGIDRTTLWRHIKANKINYIGNVILRITPYHNI